MLRACWRAFDRAAAKAEGVELRKGPRGGGRDLDQIVEHVLDADGAYLGALGGGSRRAKDRDRRSRRRPSGRRSSRRRPCGSAGEPPPKPRKRAALLAGRVRHPAFGLARDRPRLGDRGPNPPAGGGFCDRCDGAKISWARHLRDGQDVPFGVLEPGALDASSSAIPFSVLSPGMSYSSNVTPLPRSSSTAASVSATMNVAAVAWFDPANSLGYTNTCAEPALYSDPAAASSSTARDRGSHRRTPSPDRNPMPAASLPPR